MMVALGCVAAIQLDEGGSSTYLSQREGESDLTMRNTPAGGSERVVSGTILVVSTVAASGEFDHAAVTPDGEYYTPNSTVELTASAMDFSGAPAKALPADAVFTVSDAAMGTVSETTVNGSGASAVFTSSGKTGDVTIDLISGGKTVGSTILHVQEPDALSFASSEVNLNYNDVSDLGFRATYQSEQVHLKDGDINWAISDPDAGSFANNRFAVTSNVKYSGSPTVTATRGDLSATVMKFSREAISSGRRRLNANRWQRDKIVAGTFCSSVVARMNIRCSGGSSRIFSRALKAGVESICTSSMIYTRFFSTAGVYTASSRSART